MVCPKCGTEMEEVIKGGFTCPKCKKEQNKLFEEIEKNNNEYKEKKTAITSAPKKVIYLICAFVLVLVFAISIASTPKNYTKSFYGKAVINSFFSRKLDGVLMRRNSKGCIWDRYYQQYNLKIFRTR